MALSDMESHPTDVNDITHLEQHPFFRLTVCRYYFLLAIAVLLNVLLLSFIMALHVNTRSAPGSVQFLGYYIHLAFSSWQTCFWLLVVLLVQTGLGYRELYKSLHAEGSIQLSPEDQSGDRRFGGLTGRQLADMVHELSGCMKVGQVQRIIISNRPDPNAYTAHIPCVGNIVVLHSNLLEIMPPQGVRAVAAHELGHIRRRDSLVTALARIPQSFTVLLGSIILWKVGIGIFWFESFWILLQRILFAGLIGAVSAWILMMLNRIENLAGQQSEYLADACAAQACGWAATLNALLVLGERAEAIHAVTSVLEQQPHLQEVNFTEEHLLRILKRLPPQELDEDRARKFAPRLYIEERLAELRDTLCVPLSDAKIVELAKQADRDLRARQAEEEKQDTEDVRQQDERATGPEPDPSEEEAALENLLIDWRQFDQDHSGTLDLQETAALVTALRSNTGRMIFRQFLEPDARWSSHPTMRDRVLFLYDASRKIPSTRQTECIHPCSERTGAAS